MAPTDQYLSSADLKAVDFQGLIKEDVMDAIWDISKIPLPLTDLIGSDSVINAFYSWTTDKLGDPQLGGFIVDGADSDKNDSNTGVRIGNHAGILDKEVQVTERAQASGTIGRGNELAYQIMMRQRELRRNVEANALNINASQEDDGDTIPGIPAGLGTMMTAFDTGSGATPGAFAAGDWSAVVPGSRVGLTETMVRDAAQATWEDGGDPTTVMGVPTLIRALSEYMFSSSARIATLAAETNQQGPATAMGSVNVFLTDFGVTLNMIPNRIQQPYQDFDAAVASALFIFDPSFFRLTFLKGYRTAPLAKTGLADKRQMAVDWGLKALEPNAGRVLLDMDATAPVTT